jgi:hypothetical protein
MRVSTGDAQASGLGDVGAGHGAGGPRSASPASAQGRAALVEALRPVILQVLREEMEKLIRIRGLR